MEEMDDISVTLDNLKSISSSSLASPKSSSSQSETTSTQTSRFATSNTVNKQFMIEDVGHFKYYNDHSIVINFVDRVKLHMDERSVNMYVSGEHGKSFCFIYLPDNSQHEICMAEKEQLNDYFKKYLNFLQQWFDWLYNADVLKKKPHNNQLAEEDFNDPIALQCHINRLKFFNFTLESNNNFNRNNQTSSGGAENLHSQSVENYLFRDNRQKFLKNLSK